MSGPFMWFDLVGRDTDEAQKFYAGLFGWTIVDAPEPYRGWVMGDDQPWAGFAHDEEAVTGSWLPYVVVDDLDDATDRALSLGATVLKERTEGPAGTSVTIRDPAGAAVALFKPSAPA
jgi:predicted enzyme related to lactoylglutathione lyase